MDPDPTDLSLIDFKCPHCGQPVSFPENAISTLQDCPFCFQVLMVPEKGAAIGATLPVPVKTPRLVLRRLVPADAGHLHELMSDEDSFRYTNWETLDFEQVEDWIERDRNSRLTQAGANLWLAMEVVEGRKVIGVIDLFYLNEDRKEMGLTFVVNRDDRRRGFGTEAIRGTIHFVFTGLKLHRLFVQCDTRNTAAFRTLEKAGLRREAECLESEFRKGEWASFFWYAMLTREYVPTEPDYSLPLSGH